MSGISVHDWLYEKHDQPYAQRILDFLDEEGLELWNEYVKNKAPSGPERMRKKYNIESRNRWRWRRMSTFQKMRRKLRKRMPRILNRRDMLRMSASAMRVPRFNLY